MKKPIPDNVDCAGLLVQNAGGSDFKQILKMAFDAGRDYQYQINPYNGKPMNDDALSFTKWYNNVLCHSNNIRNNTKKP